MGVSIKNSLTLRSALRTLAGSGQNIEVGVNDLIYAVTRNILNSTMVRDKDMAIRALYTEAQQLLVEQKPIKQGSVKWLARVSSGLDPETGKAVKTPMDKKAEQEQFVSKAIRDVEQAIQRATKSNVTRVESSATKGQNSIRQLARRSSGLGDNGEILF